MNCLNPKCGREIVKDQYFAESEDGFLQRLISRYCRKKCKREHAPPKPERGKPTLELISCDTAPGESVSQPKDLPIRDEARKAFARSMPCCKCGAIEGIHAHHEQEEGRGTMGGKTSDRRTAPACPRCHDARHREGRSFWGELDIEAVISAINEAYDRIKKGGE